MDKIAFGKRIRDLRGDISQEKFARLLGCSQSFLSDLENARSWPSTETLLRLSQVTGRTMTWLTHGKEAHEIPWLAEELRKAKAEEERPHPPELKVVSRRDLDEIERRDTFVPVPLVSGAVAAGVPRMVEDHDIEGYCLIYESWCKKPEDYVCVRVEGDSMEPALPDGSIVAVHLKSRSPRRLNKKLVAVRHEEGVTVKELSKAGEHWLLLSYNKEYDPVVLDPHQEENPIIGKVAWWWARQE